MKNILFEATPTRIIFSNGDVDTNRRYLRFTGPYNAHFFLAKGKTLGTGWGRLSAQLPSGYEWQEPGYAPVHNFAYPSGRGLGVTV